MKHILIVATCFCLSVGGAMAQGSQFSARIGEIGIQPAIAELEAVSTPDAEQRFTLGGLYFMGAIERALQLRYTHGVNQDMLMMLEIPLLRLPIPENPSPQPFNPAVIETLFANASADFAKSIEVLDTIEDGDDFGAKIDTGDIWFDINMNNTRDPGEGLTKVLGVLGGFRMTEEEADITVRFDTSDAAWLSAYAHLLSGISDTILALQPSERITAVMADAKALDAFGRIPDDYYGIIDMLDIATALVEAVETQPDPALTQSAHAHFLSMIKDNQTFWTRVATETDNLAEWIPNDKQTSALPLAFPPGTGEVWQGVLEEVRAMLEGELLIWHPRFPDNVGVNLAKLMETPPKFDVLGMIQGRTFLPYLERGPTMSGGAFSRFEILVSGNAGLFMVILN